MENLRKRAERERAEATLYAATNFARDLLSVSDNMSRALAAVSPDARENADEMTKNLLAGVELTERELLKVFERYNIRKVETVGAKFDPNFHQALFEVPTKDHPPGTVVQEMQSGFAIGERCLRPAMVGVAKARAKGGFHYKVCHCRLVPAIHLSASALVDPWVAGTSPAMTMWVLGRHFRLLQRIAQIAAAPSRPEPVTTVLGTILPMRATSSGLRSSEPKSFSSA